MAEPFPPQPTPQRNPEEKHRPMEGDTDDSWKSTSDQDIDTAGTEADDEVPGDTNAGDIVDRTGEQMPRQSHDGLEEDERHDRS